MADLLWTEIDALMRPTTCMIAGLRAEESIAERCRRESINPESVLSVVQGIFIYPTPAYLGVSSAHRAGSDLPFWSTIDISAVF
jgi:hypothetical protein